MKNVCLKGVGGVAAATALALTLGVPGAALAEGVVDASVSMVDSSGNSLSRTIDINDLESGSITIKGEGDWGEQVQGVHVNLIDGNGNYVSGAFDFTGEASWADGYKDFAISFNPGSLQEGETYTFTIEYRGNSGNTVFGYGEYTFTVGSSSGGGDEPSAGTGGGAGGGDGTGDGGGSGSGSGSGSGDSASSGSSSSGSGPSGSSPSGGGSWGDWGSWGGSSSTAAPSEGSSGSAGNAGTPSDPVIEAPVGSGSGEAELTQEPAADSSPTAPESTQPAVETPQDTQQTPESAQSSSQETLAAAAAATKGGGGGDRGPTPKEEQDAASEADPAAQQAAEGAQGGTVLAKLGDVYSLFAQQRKPVAVQVEMQPSFSVTGIPWLLAAMLAALLLAGPAGLAGRLAGYRRGLRLPTRLGPGAPATAGTAPTPTSERRDA